MGGEPTIHPDFKKITIIAQKYFTRVTVFTNGINNNICDFAPREKDGINYNFNFFSHISSNKLLPQFPGTRIFEVVISSKSDEISIKKKLITLQDLPINQIIVSLSLDCTENIFLHRDVLVQKIMALINTCKELGYEFIIDHTLPLCFVYGTSIPIRPKGAMCNGDCAGMLDAELNVHFCNQLSDDCFPLMEKGEFIPYSVFENHLFLSHFKNQISVLEKICIDCPLYGKHCNGGCFTALKSISREDILQNTSFPIC